MTEGSLLFRDSIDINDNIHIVIPKVGEIIDCEEEYYGLVHTLTAMPVDMMVQLDDVGIDFTTIDEYELFLMLFNMIKKQDTSMVFGELDLSLFEPAMNEQNGTIVLLDRKHDIVIDRMIHDMIASAIRRIHHIEKNIRKPGNEAAKLYMIERARVKQRRKKKAARSQLEQLIVALVNTCEYKYDFERTKELSIYQFEECVRQVAKKIEYDKRMIGVYTGNIDVKTLSKDDLTWFVNK